MAGHDNLQPRYRPFLSEACPHHRGVLAGSTETRRAVIPIRILFGRSVMRYSIGHHNCTVVMHVTVTERSVIRCALFLPPSLPLLLLTG